MENGIFFQKDEEARIFKWHLFFTVTKKPTLAVGFFLAILTF